MTVFVVDDDPQFREAVVQLMRSIDLQVEEFASPTDFLSHFDPTRGGCILLDVRMPEMSGLELLKILRQRFEPPPIIMATGFAEVPTAVEAMRLGARDFLQKPISQQSLIEKVQAAIHDDHSRLKRAHAQATTTGHLQSLTPRERQTLDLLMAGHNAKEIARELLISVRTVDFHRNNVLEKMHVDNLVQLTRLIDEYEFLHSPSTGQSSS